MGKLWCRGRADDLNRYEQSRCCTKRRFTAATQTHTYSMNKKMSLRKKTYIL